MSEWKPFPVDSSSVLNQLKHLRCWMVNVTGRLMVHQLTVSQRVSDYSRPWTHSRPTTKFANLYWTWICYLAFSIRHVPVLIWSVHCRPWVCRVIPQGSPWGCDPVISTLPIPGASTVRFNHPRLLQRMQRTGKPGFSPPLGIINKFIGELIKIAGG